eukprot:600242-Ditylum_brightwellii.AAC.1
MVLCIKYLYIAKAQKHVCIIRNLHIQWRQYLKYSLYNTNSTADNIILQIWLEVCDSLMADIDWTVNCHTV